jgi:hypothetical protein
LLLSAGGGGGGRGRQTLFCARKRKVVQHMGAEEWHIFLFWGVGDWMGWVDEKN